MMETQTVWGIQVMTAAWPWFEVLFEGQDRLLLSVTGVQECYYTSSKRRGKIYNTTTKNTYPFQFLLFLFFSISPLSFPFGFAQAGIIKSCKEAKWVNIFYRKKLKEHTEILANFFSLEMWRMLLIWASSSVASTSSSASFPLASTPASTTCTGSTTIIYKNQSVDHDKK